MGRDLRIGVIGGSGWLGGAIIRSMIAAELTTPAHLTVSYRRHRPAHFEGARWTQDNQELVDRSDVILVSVRPADWPSIVVSTAGKLIISVMAGIRLQALSARFGTGRVIRALPNAAAEVRKSYTPWIAAADAGDADRALARDIFAACGVEDEVTSEGHIDYLTGLSGSGPVFPALLATAMIRDAVAHGLSDDIARRAVTMVFIGAGRLLERRNENPADTVETFVSYAGTTAAAIETMRAGGFETIVGDGLAAAALKSVNMGRE